VGLQSSKNVRKEKHADSPLKFKPTFTKPGFEIEIGGLAVDGAADTVTRLVEVRII
jgi:hypothetical protein